MNPLFFILPISVLLDFVSSENGMDMYCDSPQVKHCYQENDNLYSKHADSEYASRCNILNRIIRCFDNCRAEPASTRVIKQKVIDSRDVVCKMAESSSIPASTPTRLVDKGSAATQTVVVTSTSTPTVRSASSSLKASPLLGLLPLTMAVGFWKAWIF